MGASASAISDAVKGARLARNQLPASLVEILGHDLDRLLDNGTKTVSIAELTKACQTHTDVFLSHDWGRGQVNHRRVARINRALKGKLQKISTHDSV